MIDIALYGAGRIGKIHAGNLASQPGVRLKYIVDVDANAARELASRHNAQAAADAQQPLADASVQAVVIATSTDTHADMILAAAKARKAIFCEKPVDLAVARARACVDAVAAAKVPCLIGFQRRYDPTFAALKKRLDAGEVGDPEMLIITSRDPGAPPIAYIERSGGIFKDMLIHDFDVCRWILGDEAAVVFATGSTLTDPKIQAAGDIDSTAVTIRTKRGRLCQINTSRRAAYGYDQRFEILGSKGLLQAGNHKPTEVVAQTAQAVSQDLPEHFFLERYRQAYAIEMAHFAKMITEGASPKTGIEDGLKALELAEAAATSLKSGKPVEM